MQHNTIKSIKVSEMMLSLRSVQALLEWKMLWETAPSVWYQ